MKLTITLTVIAFLHVSAKSLAQKITLSEHNASLIKVFNEIRVQTGYDFLVSTSMLKNSNPVNIDVKNDDLQDVLKKIFEDQPLKYTIEDRSVVVFIAKKRYESVNKQNISSVTDNSEPKSSKSASAVTGRVTNMNNESLNGATVTIKRNKVATTTDVNGLYIIVAELTDTLAVSYIGYDTKLVPVKQNGIINVQLSPTSNRLDEVVVQGYGFTTQRSTTGNIGRVTAAEIAKQPVNDPLLALEGRIAGVVVSPQSGYDDGPVKIEIRGRSSINPNFSTDPLYIIDGVPLTILDVARSSTSTTIQNPNSTTYISQGLDQTGMSYSQGQNPLYNINPQDIESIEVLKDADATAIYGSRGANGVVLITTKKGKPGNTQLDVNVNNGAVFATRSLPMLNTPQYLAMRREEFKNDGVTATPINAPDLFLWSQTSDTDWQKYAYGHTGDRINTQVALSGGDDHTTFRVSSGYTRTEDITAVSGADQRATVAVDITNSTANKRLTTTLSVNYGYSNVNQINLSGLSTLPPNAPLPYTATGALNFLPYHQAGISFPFSNLLQPYNSSGSMVSAHLNLTYNILKGLNATASLGYNNNQLYSTLFKPIASLDPNATPPPTGSSSFGNTHAHNTIFEPQLTYNTLIGKGKFNALAGATVQDNTTDGFTTNGTGYTNDILLKTITQAPVVTASDNYGQYKYAGVFGRIGYNWEGKYIINISGRHDGSSRFGPGDQFGNFGSVGAAWILSDEKWVRSFLPKSFDFVKLRASYGITGSDGVADYQYLAQWGNPSGTLTSYNGVTPLVPQLNANPNFHWQVNKKLDAALSIEMFDGKLSFDVDYYQNRCDNELVSLLTPEITGFTSVTANNPAAVQNSGLEFMINTSIIQSSRFSWRSSFNIGINRNKLLAYPGLATSPYRNQYKIGQSIDDQYVLNYAGVDPLTGLYSYTDHNGDGFIATNNQVFPGTKNDDNYILINRAPDFTGGFLSTLTFGKLQLTMNFIFAKQMGLNLVNGGTSGVNLGAVQGLANIAEFVYQHRWQYPGDVSALYGRVSSGSIVQGAVNSSNAGWTDASYLRFQTVSLSYGLPSKILSKIGVKTLSVNVNTNNLFVITAYKGLDPQITTFGQQPPFRTIEAGLTASF